MPLLLLLFHNYYYYYLFILIIIIIIIVIIVYNCTYLGYLLLRVSSIIVNIIVNIRNLVLQIYHFTFHIRVSITKFSLIYLYVTRVFSPVGRIAVDYDYYCLLASYFFYEYTCTKIKKNIQEPPNT